MKKKHIQDLRDLSKMYPLFGSGERELVDDVMLWVEEADRSLMPKSWFDLAASCVDCYEYKLRSEGNFCDGLIKTLRGIIATCYDSLASRRAA